MSSTEITREEKLINLKLKIENLQNIIPSDVYTELQHALFDLAQQRRIVAAMIKDGQNTHRTYNQKIAALERNQKQHERHYA